MRRLVDPTTFRTPVTPSDSELGALSSSELKALMSGLKVRIRSASQGVRQRPPSAPGPGEYVKPSTLAKTAPRWETEAFTPCAADVELRRVPGPGQYDTANTPTTKRHLVASRIDDVSQAAALRNPHPGPCAYTLRPPTAPSFKFVGRPQHKDGPGGSTPGPSHYTLGPLAQPSLNGAQSPRFPRLAQVAPGPGYYEVPGLSPKQQLFSPRRHGFH
jgi:hypothetical protein